MKTFKVTRMVLYGTNTIDRLVSIVKFVTNTNLYYLTFCPYMNEVNPISWLFLAAIQFSSNVLIEQALKKARYGCYMLFWYYRR